MNSRFWILLIMLCAVGRSAYAGELTGQPFETIRTLEEVQDQIKDGSVAAHEYLPQLIDLIDASIAKTSTNTLLDPRNTRAVLVFALSGGTVQGVERLIATEELSPVYLSIGKGAISYGQGRFSEAAKHLNSVDARTLPASLAARVALVQSILSYKSDLNRAIALLDLARLLGNGTLVDEAALRRQMTLESAAQREERFFYIAQQYFKKYNASVFSDVAKQQFAIAAAAFDYSAEGSDIERVERTISSLSRAEKFEVYLLLAQTAIFLGNIKLTEFCSSGAEKLDDTGKDRPRYELYAASAGVAGAQPEAALERLAKIKPAQLEAADAALLQAALAVGDAVVRLPDGSETADRVASQSGKGESIQDANKVAAPRAEEQTLVSDETSVAAANRAIAEADQLLGRVK